ncbi:MAG: HNH endonuclease signature motif containing protein [Microbacterium sp.]|uniref:HNH endonuclease signature motif containing protein n=1 Tax=Microbacterium sp. TaxID=51671 RepID=UPI0039E33A09
MRRLDDDEVVALMTEAAAVIACADRLRVVSAAVVSERSVAPHGGLSGARGHRSSVTLVQQITGGTRGDASRIVRAGTSLLDEGADVDDAPGGMTADVAAAAPASVWHAGLREAMLSGLLTVAQHDAIRRGLGEPGEGAEAARVWAIAARQLADEAPALPVEELATRARAMRDALDPVGAEQRFTARFAARSWRTWRDADGGTHARIDFDDEMAAWVQAIRDAALRPRRGGPRFVTDDERAAAQTLQRDPRTDEQLEYDLMMDVLRAGALASAEDVFGARQLGVRLVAVKDAVGSRDAFGRLLAIGHREDGGAAVPGSVLDRALCDTGSSTVTVDTGGNPLDVGREQRLFTSNQRIALAVRDGGCVWPGCDRPASYCEAHHCDHWAADHGRTDIDRGVLLCRFHHLLLHNQGWRISRDRHGPVLLHPPGASEKPIELRSRSPLWWAWDPPPRRARWRAA